MTPEERKKKAIEQAKKSSQDLFKKRPTDVQKELEDETVLGNPENLIKPDNKEE